MKQSSKMVCGGPAQAAPSVRRYRPVRTTLELACVDSSNILATKQ